MFQTSLLALSIWALSVGIYRLYFHPLSRFPGPKIAAVTSLYEFYYNVLNDGVFIWEIEKMHKKYGPIVRINPHEIHINDPEFYNEIYTSSPSKRDKYWGYVKGIALPNSVVSTIDHKHHAMRRKYLSNFFSRESIRSIESLIHDKIDTLITQMKVTFINREAANLNVLFHALAIDIISHYAYGTDYHFLDHQNHEEGVRASLLAVSKNFHLMRFSPIDPTVIENIPSRLLHAVWPAAGVMMDAKRRIRAQAVEILSNSGKGKPERETIFTALMNPELAAVERTATRMQDEAFLLLQAGSETTGHAMSIMMFYILRDKSILKRVKSELKQLMPLPSSRPSLSDLQSLPYFSAVVNEGFRLSFGTLTRLPRVSPIDNVKYKDWVIPAGTPLSETAYFIHMNPSIFPDPSEFDPGRWIRAGDQRKRLESALVNFSKGRRQCLGINLAHAEIYLTLASLIRRVDVNLLDDNEDAIRPYRDRVVILPKTGTYNVEVRINRIEED